MALATITLSAGRKGSEPRCATVKTKHELPRVWHICVITLVACLPQHVELVAGLWSDVSCVERSIDLAKVVPVSVQLPVQVETRFHDQPAIGTNLHNHGLVTSQEHRLLHLLVQL